MEEVSKKKRKNKIQHPYTHVDMYKHYLSIIDIDSDYYVDISIYRAIISEYYQALMNSIINDSKTVKLHFRLGHLFVGKKKPKFVNHRNVGIDWVEAKKYHKWILYDNDHTHGFKFRFHWTKEFCRVVNKEFYRFVASRGNKRALAKAIKNGNDYLEIRR